MRPSPHNIVSEVTGTDLFIIVNLLSGNADLLTGEELHMLLHPGSSPCEEFIIKGYIADEAQEQQRFRMAYLDFLDQREAEECQIFFVPTWLCNFDCSYCYQAPYNPVAGTFPPRMADAFFSCLNSFTGNRKKYITLFGGEPLLAGKDHKRFIELFVSQCAAHQLDLAVVTNGYQLDQYAGLFSDVSIREIQVTLDGTESMHNRRRQHKGGKATFQRIVDGIDQCLSMGYPVNLRVVIDRENMGDLPAFSRFAIEKGWTGSPLFKTQLGRNYELHHCHTSQQKLYSRLTLYADLYKMIREYPEILSFHRPAFSVSRFLADNGYLPPPLFDACPACKSEWVFDHTGAIYSCTATAGKPGEQLGTFYPDMYLDREKVSKWQKRDVLTISGCRECSLQLACGGGCGAVAKNNKGDILETDCRPVKELLGMGIATYFPLSNIS